MAAGATYEPIATTTLASAAATITFSSITSAYTDLRLVLICTGSSATRQAKLTINSDTATNYSSTLLYGDGTAAGSYRSTSQTGILFDYTGFSTTIPHFYTFDFFSYAGSTNKTILGTVSEDNNGSGSTTRGVGLWRSTSAITAVSLTATVGNFAIGTTATLYGIKAA